MDIAALLLEAFQAAGADDGLTYVSVPITSGPRELKLLAELRCTREELRSVYRARWLAEVVGPNEQEAVTYAARVRALFPQQLVVEPARLHVSGWAQEDYNIFWDALIRQYALRLVATPDWAFSVGSRQEVDVAWEIGLPILDVRGRLQTAEDLAASDSLARETAAELGFSGADIERYLPPLALAGSGSRPPGGVTDELARREALVNRASSEVFSWLRGERALQLRAFSPEKDDQHTLEGLEDDAWWSRQLARYYEQARRLGVDTPTGRQALAKFGAAAIALLESTVRLHGWLPNPGVRMGANGEE